MSLPRFKYFEAKSLEEAVALLKTYGHKASILAGGTDLLGAMKARVSSPEVIVDIKKIEGLDYIREQDGLLKMGALTGLRAIRDSSLVGKRCGLLQEVIDLAGSPAMRNMATIGGNLCQDVRCWYYRASPWCGEPFHCYRKGGEKCFVTGRGDITGVLSGEGYVMGKEIALGGVGLGVLNPALGVQSPESGGDKTGDGRYHSILGTRVCQAACPSDMMVALTGVGAKIRVLGQRGERLLPVEELWLNDTPWLSLERDEIISEIQIPFMTDATLGSYVKFRARKALDFALVSVAAVLTLEGGLVKDADIILGGVAPTPWRAKESEKGLIGRRLEDTAERAAEVAVTGAQPSPMSAYKVPLSKAAVRKALQAIACSVSTMQ